MYMRDTYAPYTHQLGAEVHMHRTHTN